MITAAAGTSSSRLDAVFGDGLGGFNGFIEYEIAPIIQGLAAGDVDHDDWPDLVVAGEGQVIEILNTPTAATDTHAVDFGSRPLGSAAAPQTAMLVNVGLRPLNFGSTSITGAHGASFTTDVSGRAGVTLGILESCPLTVTFRPAAAGALNAELDVRTDDPTGPLAVALTGSSPVTGGSSTGGGSAGGGASSVAPAQVTLVDRTPPAMRLTVRRRVRLTARLRSLPVKVNCSEACTINARLLISAKQARKLRLHRAHPGLTTVGRGNASSPRAGKVTVTVRFTAALTKALRHAEAVDLRLMVAGSDAAHNARQLTATIHLSRG